MSAAPPSLTAPATSAQPDELDALRPEDRVTFNPRWLQAAWPELQQLAAAREPFTADTLRAPERGLGAPAHPAHIGALFSKASKAGLIEHAGFVRSSSRSRHGAWIQQWRGVTPATATASATSTHGDLS